MVDFWAVPCRIFSLCLAYLLVQVVITESCRKISGSFWPTGLVVVEPWRWLGEVVVVQRSRWTSKVVMVE